MESPSPDLAIVIERDEEGWWVAQIPEVRGVVSQGRTPEEARAMALDALILARNTVSMNPPAG